jgi:hypothetical protein
VIHFVFKVGPIFRNDNVVNAYFVYPGSPGYQVFFANDDRSGLSHIAAAFPHTFLACEPQMYNIGREFGFRLGSFTDETAHMLGLVTFDMALPGQLQQIEREELIYQFGTACAEFYNASPWRFASATGTLGIAITGSVRCRLEARILGSAGIEYGLATYSIGSVHSIKNPLEDEHLIIPSSLDTLGVTFSDSPDFAIDAMRRAYGIPKLPEPVKIANGERIHLVDQDLLILTASLRGTAVLSDNDNESIAQVQVADLSATAICWRA